MIVFFNYPKVVGATLNEDVLAPKLRRGGDVVVDVIVDVVVPKVNGDETGSPPNEAFDGMEQHLPQIIPV